MPPFCHFLAFCCAQSCICLSLCLCGGIGASAGLFPVFWSGKESPFLVHFKSNLFLPFFEPLLPLSALCLAIVFGMEVFVQEGGFLRTDDACQVLFAGFPHALHAVESLQ